MFPWTPLNQCVKHPRRRFIAMIETKILPPRQCKLETCGVTFTPAKSWQEFCSVECRNAWHRGAGIKCPGCGIVFDRGENAVQRSDLIVAFNRPQTKSVLEAIERIKASLGEPDKEDTSGVS